MGYIDIKYAPQKVLSLIYNYQRVKSNIGFRF